MEPGSEITWNENSCTTVPNTFSTVFCAFFFWCAEFVRLKNTTLWYKEIGAGSWETSKKNLFSLLFPGSCILFSLKFFLVHWWGGGTTKRWRRWRWKTKIVTFCPWLHSRHCFIRWYEWKLFRLLGAFGRRRWMGSSLKS